MERVLVNIIKKIIQEQNLDIGVVKNLLGSLPDNYTEEELNRPSDWAVFYINSVEPLEPDTIIKRLSATEFAKYQTAKGISGTLLVAPDQSGTYLLSTIASVPSATGFPISIQAEGRQITVYVDETLIKRSVNKLETTINLPAGDSPINLIITGGGTSVIKVSYPADIRTEYVIHVPPIPIWRTPIAISTNYVDPKIGQTGNGLFWYNQAKAGGWGVYKVTTETLGMFIEAGIQTDELYHLTLSGTSTLLNVNDVLFVDSGTLGAVQRVTINETGEQNVIVAASNLIEPASILNATAAKYIFTHLIDIPNSSSAAEVSFVDTNVEYGQTYQYALDAYAKADPSIRTDKSVIKSVVAGDVTPPGSITLQSFSVIDNMAYVKYHTPTDTDYLGVRVYYNNVNSGTIDSLLVDFGIPDVNDSLQFLTINSGTYYFRTFDIVGNEQTVVSGVSYAWSGSQTINVTNLPPTVVARLLSSAETTTDGYDPYLIGRFELNANGEEGESLTIEYRKADEGAWTSTGVPPAVKVNVERQTQNNWLRVRAFDGTLYSDEMILMSDYDIRPEVSSLTGRINGENNTVDITGAVDDDTKSFTWQVRDGYESGTLLASGAGDTESVKSFGFSFNIDDGSRRHLRVRPYGRKYLLGPSDIVADQIFDLPPRTRVSFAEGASDQAVTHSTLIVTLSALPTTATTYYLIDSGTYSVYTQPLTINRSTEVDKIVYYYSEVAVPPAGTYLREPLQRLRIDADSIPEIHSGTLTEISAGRLTLTISDVDEDVKYWEAYVRRSQWPTINSGFINFDLNLVDQDYLRYRSSPDISNSFSFDTITVNSGTWYAIVVPYDSYHNPGPNLGLTTVLGSGTATLNPVLYSILVEPFDESSSNQFNRVKWQHNDACNNETVTVQIWVRRSDQHQGAYEEITSTRYAWQDSEKPSEYSNSDDGTTWAADDYYANKGSFLHSVDRGSKEDWQWLTWYYLIKLYNSTTLVATYEASHSGYYGPLIA